MPTTVPASAVAAADGELESAPRRHPRSATGWSARKPSAASSTGSSSGGVSAVRAASMSGWMPSGATLLCSGVNQRLIVIRTPPSFSSRPQTWTVFLPNDGSPMSVARPVSCSAAATISEAEAEPPLIRTDHRQRRDRSPRRHRWSAYSRTSSPADSCVKMRPSSDELAGDLLRRVDVATRVVAQVEDDLVGALVEEVGEAVRELVAAGAEKPLSAM